MSVGQANVTDVYLLMGSYTGQSFSITFNGTWWRHTNGERKFDSGFLQRRVGHRDQQ